MDDCGYFSVCDVAQNVYSKNVFKYRHPRKRRVRCCSSSWSRLIVHVGRERSAKERKDRKGKERKREKMECNNRVSIKTNIGHSSSVLPLTENKKINLCEILVFVYIV